MLFRSPRQSVLNLACLGYRIVKDMKAEGTVVRTGRKELKRKERAGETYVVSRWVPVIQDIMEVSSISPLPTLSILILLRFLSSHYCCFLIHPPPSFINL